MGQSPDSSTYNQDEVGIPFYQGNADFGELNPVTRYWCSIPTKTANKDDILFSVRAPIGAINVAVEKCCIGRGLAALTANIEVCDSIYLRYALYAKCDSIIEQGTGSTFKAINKAILTDTEIPLPPLTEQQKIAAELDQISGLIAKRKSQMEKLDLLVKAKFVEMFGGIHDSELYPYAPLQSITKVLSGGTPNRDVFDYWSKATIPWIKTTEPKNRVIYDSEEKISELGLKNSSAKMIPAGSILVAMYGQGKTRGMTGLLAKEATTNQACACIFPSKQVEQFFLWEYFILSYDKLRAMAKGGNQPNLNVAMIKQFPILLPPLPLQTKFADFVQKTEQTKTTMQKSLAGLETLYRARMQEYFE